VRVLAGVEARLHVVVHHLGQLCLHGWIHPKLQLRRESLLWTLTVTSSLGRLGNWGRVGAFLVLLRIVSQGELPAHQAVP